MIKEYNVLNKKFMFQTHDDVELTSELIEKYNCNIDIETVHAYSFLMKDGEYFLDIGANIGWNTIFASYSVGNNGKVFSFEPEEKNFKVLSKNIELNSLKNVTLIQKALSEKESRGNLYKSNNNFGNHILEPSFYNPKTHESYNSVSISTIDNFIKDNDIDTSKVSLIKIDVEGSEPKVLNGGKNFFLENRPNIILEFSPFLIKQCGSSLFDILSFIDKYDYVPFLIKQIDLNNPKYDLQELSIMEIINLAKNLFDTCSYKDILLMNGNKL